MKLILKLIMFPLALVAVLFVNALAKNRTGGKTYFPPKKRGGR